MRPGSVSMPFCYHSLSPMNIHLIYPCRREDIWRKRGSTFTLPPMALVILAALTPRDCTVKVTDELVDEIDFDFPADLIVLGVNTTNAFRSYEVAKRCREKGAAVVKVRRRHDRRLLR